MTFDGVVEEVREGMFLARMAHDGHMDVIAEIPLANVSDEDAHLVSPGAYFSMTADPDNKHLAIAFRRDVLTKDAFDAARAEAAKLIEDIEWAV